MTIDDLAKQAADSVRAVMNEAHKQAAEIIAAAEAEAREIHARAEVDARERIDRAREALEELGGRLGVAGAVDPAPAVADPVPEEAPATAAAVPDPVPVEPEPEPAPEPEVEEPRPSATPAPAATGGAKSGDAQAARLVALKLALDGVSKDEARAHLASEYDVSDLDSLLGDVYARAGK